MTTTTSTGVVDGVGRVSMLSTGSVDIHPQQVFGSRLPMYVWIAGSRRWLSARPINVYIIEHARGLVLFDTGQDRASLTDPSYFPGGVLGFLYRRLARFHIGPSDTLTAQLSARGYTPDSVKVAVISHLHEDHVGGIRELPNAEIVVSQDEWTALQQPHPEARGFLRKHVDVPGINWRRVAFQPTSDPSLAPFDAAYDLMGDGTLMLLPTSGHTPGSISMLVRRAHAAPLLLVGDLTYATELLEIGRVPGVGDTRQLRIASDKVRQLKARQPNLAILAAHDPGAADRLRQANLGVAA
ncbi:MAG TPA: N-acyl homoserine lactonase family protein [Chloroflexota bacterium]|nr:N-acyl homoserine lactonase family protein [Chloroflexota bacterium]